MQLDGPTQVLGGSRSRSGDLAYYYGIAPAGSAKYLFLLLSAIKFDDSGELYAIAVKRLDEK